MTHAVSDTISPVTPQKPSFDAAMAAAAMVFTLLGATGQSSATEPWKITRLPSPSDQSDSRFPASRKQEGCFDMRMDRACIGESNKHWHEQANWANFTKGANLKRTYHQKLTSVLLAIYLEPTISQTLWNKTTLSISFGLPISENICFNKMIRSGSSFYLTREAHED